MTGEAADYLMNKYGSHVEEAIDTPFIERGSRQMIAAQHPEQEVYITATWVW
jgi:hypothetical protein